MEREKTKEGFHADPTAIFFSWNDGLILMV